MAHARAMSKGCSRWACSTSNAMHAQLMSSGTVLAWGAGDHGAIHGKTMSVANHPRVKMFVVVLLEALCKGLVKFKPIADAP